MLASNAIATATAGPPKHCALPSSLHHHTRLPLVCHDLVFRPHRCFVVRAAANERRSSGDAESKAVLEAFFLGKAFAEALTEKVGTAVGEFLSDIGRWQAEQQRQIRDFQEEVQERARVAKLKAVREAEADKSKTRIRPSDNGAAPTSTNAGNGSIVSSPRRPTAAQQSEEL